MNSILAINGGPRTVPEGAFKNVPRVTDGTKTRMQEFLNRDDFGVMLKEKPSLELAQTWADYLGVNYCIPVNSGTAALHMCVAALGIGPGDEVIMPALTFWASAAAVLHHNAIPVFVDIDAETFCVDPDRIEEKITERTKAIMPVHLHGMPADMGPIMAIAEKHDIKVISDACQAHGSSYKGQKIGAIEDVTAFSMEVSKPLSSGSEGGLFVTNNEEYAQKANLLRQFGEIVTPGQAREYNSFGLGWNYRMSEFGAVFGLGQLEQFDERIQSRRESCEALSEGLDQIKGIKGPARPIDRESAYFNYVIEFCPEELGLDMDINLFREIMEKALTAEGIPCGKWQNMPVPAQAVFQNLNAYGKGCPWNCSHYKGAVAYSAEEYPQTQRFLASHSYVGPHSGKLCPDSLELAEMCLEGFSKVSANAGELVNGGKGI